MERDRRRIKNCFKSVKNIQKQHKLDGTGWHWIALCRMLGSFASSDSASSGGVGAGGGVVVDTRDPLDPLDLPKSQVEKL